jgi:hypothetical protein
MWRSATEAALKIGRSSLVSTIAERYQTSYFHDFRLSQSDMIGCEESPRSQAAAAEHSLLCTSLLVALQCQSI